MIAIGDKVVCIKTPIGTDQSPLGRPIKDKVYVIQGMYIDCEGCLAFYIIGKPTYRGSIEVGWGSELFRKLEDIRVENALKQKLSQRL